MEEEIENWEDCGESSQKKYQVSNLGRVKSITKVNKIERFLKGYPDKDGYLRVIISKKPKFIHTLVSLAFIGPRPDGLVIDHFDRSRTNNKVSNLRYCTISENTINSDNYRDDILEQGVERRKVFRKESYEANREAILEKAKEYHKANREAILKKMKEYYEANREKNNEKRKEYYEVNKEVILAKQKEKYTCKCGSILQKTSKARHERESQTHKAYLENLNK